MATLRSLPISSFFHLVKSITCALFNVVKSITRTFYVVKSITKMVDGFFYLFQAIKIIFLSYISHPEKSSSNVALWNSMLKVGLT